MGNTTEYVVLADMEIHVAPGARVTILPHVLGPNGKKPVLPFHLVLEPQQVRQLAQDLLDAADQSAEDSKATRN